jgi:iron complex outermembrane receptor protein
MNSNPKLSYAIAAILGGSGMGMGTSYAAPAADATAADSDSIQEIVVTATRRNETIQNVPITIQALSGAQLKELNVTTFDDLLKYTPNVTFSGNSPGTGNIFMRGLSSGDQGNQSSATTGQFPNVAVYLDDASMQFPDRNVDVYLVDMERVEVLEGPQGTLFGGGAQAGAIRYITNKPKLDVTEGNANAGYGYTAGGGQNSMANATINIPLIADTLAVRAVIFNDHRGGYIDNVPSTGQFTNVPTAAALKAYPSTPANPNGPTASPVANNAALVGNDTNTVDYTGIRVSALAKFNDSWNLLLQQNYQNMQANGYFSDMPVGIDGATLAPYQITAFTPAYDNDKYEMTSWTLNGNVMDLLKVVYTGSYLDRNLDQQADYSNYLRSPHGSYYSCTGRGAGYNYFRSAKPTTCYAPVGSWNDAVQNTHQSHEIRLSTNEDNRFRALVGGYWEEFTIKDQMNFNYLPIPQCDAQNLAIALTPTGPDCLSAVGPLPGTYANNPALRVNSNTAFGEDDKRGYRQAAFFTSMDFDIIPKVLTVTGGTRYYHYDDFEQGSEFYSSSSVLNLPNGAVTAKGGAGFPINLNKTEHGWKSRGNLTWHIMPDIMAYYTYSQGFRPGGFNRTQVNADGTIVLKAEAPYTAGDSSTKQYYKPVGYDSDNLINQEIGIKSEWFDHRLQANISLYRMAWDNVQLSLFDPVHLGNTTFDVNGPTYVVKGIELQLVARVTEGLTVQGSSSWNSTNQTNAPCLQSNIPASKGNPTPVGNCITQINGAAYTNPYGVLDTSPAFSPSILFNVRARYDFNFGEYKPFVMAGANHIGSQRNQPASFPTDASPLCSPIPTTTHCQYTMPGYTTYDASFGVAKDQWTVQVTGSNITNSDASTMTSSAQFIESQVPLRPRVVMLQMGYKF